MEKSSNELSIQGLKFYYPSYKRQKINLILDEINLNVYSNQISVLIGPSGSGKTTLLNLIANITSPTKGSIIYKEDGKNKRAKIGYVFQNPSLIPWRTVKQNVLLGIEISGKVTKDVEREANKLLTSYGLKDFINCLPSTLSGGMQQRVSIIRAVLSGANILLLDEPFSNTDFILRKELQEDLLRLVTEQNLIAIMITHDLMEAVKIADQIIILSARPASVIREFKIDVKRSERMDTDFIVKKELYKYIEDINQVLNEQGLAHKVTDAV